MIVCDLTHAYHATSGGIRTIIKNRREYIINHTDDYHVLIVPGDKNKIEEGDQWTTVQIKCPYIPGAKPYRIFLNKKKIIKALETTRPDVVTLHTAYVPSEYRAAFNYRKKYPETITTGYFHTDFSGAYVGTLLRSVLPDIVANPLERRADKYIRHIYQSCDLSFANSKEQALRLESLGVSKVVPLSLGVDLGVFHRDKHDSTFRTELGLASDALILSYAGRFDAEKRPFVMVEAVRMLNAHRPACLVMAGQGPLREQLETLEDEGAPIRVLPYQQTAEALARVLASSDIYFSAGPHETFGLSVVEAQACGLPVVGVDAGALIERVPAEIGRLAQVDDPDSMVEAILDVAHQREEMGRLARKHVRERFSWKTNFDQQFGLFQEALGLPNTSQEVVAETALL